MLCNDILICWYNTVEMYVTYVVIERQTWLYTNVEHFFVFCEKVNKIYIFKLLLTILSKDTDSYMCEQLRHCKILIGAFQPLCFD